MAAMARLTTLFFAMWLGVTVDAAVDLHKRILNGRDCNATERPYHVQLRYANDHESYCGGSLISPQWILTAAHCNESNMEIYSRTGHELEIELPARIFRDINGTHDIMLLKLKQANHSIEHVNLPNCTHPPAIGATVEIAGHAANTTYPNNIKVVGYVPILQCADMKIADCEQHRTILEAVDSRFYRPRQHEDWLCGYNPPVDTCRGDSGGGLVYNGMIYGLLSFGHIEACVEPAVFMNLCSDKYNNWIKNTINGGGASAASG